MFSFQKKFDIQVGEIVFHCHKLSSKNLRDAAQAVTDAQVRAWHNIGPEILDVLRTRNTATEAAATKPDAKAQAEARYAAYDSFMVARLALDGWSIAEKYTTDAIDALDEEQMTALHRGILDVSLPPLEIEAQQVMEGKDSAPSTNT